MPAFAGIVLVAAALAGCGVEDSTASGPTPSTVPAGSVPRAAQLIATDGQAGDTFGGARWYDTFRTPVEPVYYATPGQAAMSSDGTVAVVGAPGATADHRPGAGAVYLFTARDGEWSQAAKLTAGDAAPYDALGWTVAVSGDGDEVLAGAPYANSAVGEDSGAAYVFRRSAGSWSQRAKLVPSDATAYDEFGWSVAVARRGRTAAVGAPGRTVADSKGAGATYLLARSSLTDPWDFAGVSTGDPATAGAQFGSAVDLSADGSTLVATEATHLDRTEQLFPGATSVFTTTDAWRTGHRLARLADPTHNADGSSSAYGVDTTISDDGASVAVAAPDVNAGRALGAGAALLYTTTCGWQRPDCTGTTALTPRHPASYGYFGSAVALTADGRRLFLGNDGVGSDGQGEGEVVTLGSPSATAPPVRSRAPFPAPNAARGRFGTAVAISASGAIGLATAPWLRVRGDTRRGAAYVVTFARHRPTMPPRESRQER